MSEQERPKSPSTLKHDAKLKPEIPRKPNPGIPPQTDGGKNSSLPGGKVQSIISKFSRKESSETVEEQAINGNGEPERSKRPPMTKPKPDRASVQIHIGKEQAPPLPLKRSRFLKKQRSLGAHDGHSIDLEFRRSAPDGKEVEIEPQARGGVETELHPDTPLSLCCKPSCCCVCHMQRPGMKLIWVPVDGEVEEWCAEEEVEVEVEEVEEEEGGGEGESEAGDELDRTFVYDKEVLGQDKSRFRHSLNILMAEGHRRLSDPGPPSIFSSLASTRSQSPPVPPKRSQSPSIHLTPPQHNEDNIYEATLPVLDSTPTQNRELGIPQIKLCKPVRRGKLSNSTSDPSSEFHLSSDPVPRDVDIPPAIPPRVPLYQDALPSVPLLPPTLEARRPVRPPSPSSSTSSGLSPQKCINPPPSPIMPCRAPPPPPKTDPRRLSSASVTSLRLCKEDKNEGDDQELDPLEGLKDSLRRELVLWESRLQDEPLYQTYRASVITKEIRRQTVSRNISKTSADYQMDLTTRRSGAGASSTTGNGGLRSSPVPSPGQSTLWQDLQKVRDSGVLEQLSPELCKYQESMFEVVTSETSYLRSLRVLTDHFMDNRELEKTLIIRDKKTLFSNVLRVREVSERFLKDLEERVFEELVFPDICDIIHYHAQHNFPAYIDYVRNQIFQEKIFTKLMKDNVQFAAVISRLQESPQCQRLPFMSFLLLPFQRITRIKMLIENILKRTKEGTNEEQTASKALASVSKIIDECNTQVGKMKQTEELIHISKTLEFDKLKAIPIISQSRYLEKKGELQEMSKGGTLFNSRLKFNSVYLFLFNDLLLITIKKR
ncbi:rho guanine nucleotide exchange factor 15 isoform X2 [Gouania willdenowi]|uniref:rho guanine nucleotide exchange factor 15 isoform X2 n=1 Tax=Gouania willdenowi TaxID=441366 RepID=UPI00105462AC|nr:rho guanine nucleotide exchange factor 15-like isoform X2 [Gouania willdenowi]